MTAHIYGSNCCPCDACECDRTIAAAQRPNNIRYLDAMLMIVDDAVAHTPASTMDGQALDKAQSYIRRALAILKALS